jgi:hypothetical protein
VRALLLVATTLATVACGTTPPPPLPHMAPSAAAVDAAARGLTESDLASMAAGGVDPGAIACNGHQTWSDSVGGDAKAGAAELMAAVDEAGVTLTAEQRAALEKDARRVMLWRLIRTILLDGNFNNLGATTLPKLRRPDGWPVVVFRTGITPHPGQPGSCYDSLIHQGGVTHVLNLYYGVMPTDDLAAEERKAVEAAGGSYYHAVVQDPGASRWRDQLREDPSEASKRQVMDAVAKLINEEVLRPGGKPPRGNMLVHCGGGMHRTGMVIGVIDRCLNGRSDELIAADLRRHTAWRSEDRPAGYEPENLEFIREFDCGLLQAP